MATNGVLTISMAVADNPTRLAADLAACSNERRLVERFIERQFRKGWNGRPNKFSIRVDSSTTGSTQDPLDRDAPTITITFANITAGETIVIGNVTLTWAAAAANQNEVTIGADLAAATTNLTAAINAHTSLRGIFSASGVTATGVVTVQFRGDPRIGALIGLSETGDAVAVSASSFALDTTEAYASASYLYAAGLP